MLAFSISSLPAQDPTQRGALSSASVSAVRFVLGGNAAAIPAQFIGNLIFLPVRINEGKASLFELDSSSTTSSIDAAHASALGLQIQAGPGVDGVVRGSVMNLPGVDIPSDSLSADSRKDFGAQVGKLYEGSLGNDFFSKFVIQIDYARRTVELFDPVSFHYSGQGIALPLAFAGGVPVVRAKFSTVTRKDFEADFAVNTALDASVLISDTYAETHRLFSSRGKTISALDPELGFTAHVAFEHARDFRIGSFKPQGTIIEFGPVPEPSGDPRLAGEIGGGMLHRFNVIFDYPHRTMFLEPGADFPNDDQEDKSGLSVVAEGPALKIFKVAEVRASTPGAEAGIRQGDVIAGIDEEAAADLTLAEVRDLFRQVGHIYKLLIERDGKTVQVTVQMRRLLSA
jgi:hypothetical protein